MILTDERIKEIASELADTFADEEGGYSGVAWFIASGIRQALKEALEWRDMESAPRDGTPALFKQDGNYKAWNENARENAVRVDFWSKQHTSFYRQLPEAPYVGWQPLPPFGPTVDKGEG